MAMGRIVRLYVGNFEKGNETSETVRTQDLSSLDIEFDVTRSVRWYENEAQIVIYNPSPDTLSMLMTTGNSVVLQAGYDDETVGNIFVGQIAMAVPKRMKRDVTVTLTCLSARGAFYQLARLNMAVAFEKGTTVRECLDFMCSYAGIALRSGFASTLSQEIPYSYNKSGTFTAVIEDFTKFILIPYFNKHIYIDNNELIVFGEGDTIDLEQVTMDYDHGLIEAFKERDETLNKVNFGEDPAYYTLSGSDQECPEPKEKPSKQIDRTPKIAFKSLMNPALVPNAFVIMDSRTGDSYDSVLGITGRYVITECRYSGGNTGSDFTVNCKAQEAS